MRIPSGTDSLVPGPRSHSRHVNLTGGGQAGHPQVITAPPGDLGVQQSLKTHQLDRGQQTFFKEPDSNRFQLHKPRGLCHNYSTWPLEQEIIHRQYVNE